MKTTHLKRAEMRRGLACLVPINAPGISCHEKTICDCGVIELLDDLDTQESELTKLRKRVEVLTTALESVYPACSGYIPCEDGWEYNYDTDRLVKLVVDVKDALSESAKIAGEK